MDEYEVDLIDYLRVIWWGKWIILACLVLAVAVSAGVMWTRPDEYAVTVQYQYYEQLTKLLSPRQSDPNSQVSSTSNEGSGAFSLAIDLTQSVPHEVRLTKKISMDNYTGSVTLSGPIQPSKLSQTSENFTSLFRKNLAQQMQDSVQMAIDSADLRVAQLSKERDMLKARMTAALATNDPIADYLAAKVADLEGTIVQNQALVETLRTTDPSALFQLNSSQQGPSLVGPNRKMSVAVAGVLGLFVGVLLAFFVHYLVSARKRETTPKQT